MADDVRMKGFARRTTVDDAWAWLDAHLKPLSLDSVPLAEAAGRVLGREVRSEVDVPGFARAMMDGLAVRAADTIGASGYNRLKLALVGEARPGRPWPGRVGAAEAVRIMTGSPMPEGADAVLPAEFVEWADRAAWAHAQVPPGGHVGQPGEDVAAGTTVLAAGRVLRPQDVGLLASIGVRDVPAVARPKVAIVATGNELLPVGSRPAGCRIVDSNSVMLAALVRRDGGVPEPAGIVPDEPEAMLAALRRDADVLVVAGASSVGAEDYMPGLLAEHGTLAIHGIAMRPGSPTGMGGLDGRLVFLLPGNPVSCLCAYDFFAGRAIRALGRRSTGWPYRSVRAPLRRKIASTVGRREYVRVRLDAGQVEPLAVGGSSVLSSTVRADGFVLVPDDSEGYPPGAHVDVYLYD